MRQQHKCCWCWYLFIFHLHSPDVPKENRMCMSYICTRTYIVVYFDIIIMTINILLLYSKEPIALCLQWINILHQQFYCWSIYNRHSQIVKCVNIKLLHYNWFTATPLIIKMKYILCFCYVIDKTIIDHKNVLKFIALLCMQSHGNVGNQTE